MGWGDNDINDSRISSNGRNSHILSSADGAVDMTGAFFFIGDRRTAAEDLGFDGDSSTWGCQPEIIQVKRCSTIGMETTTFAFSLGRKPDALMGDGGRNFSEIEDGSQTLTVRSHI